MNRLSLNTKIITADERLVIDGIEFNNAVLIKLSIDDVSSEKLGNLDSALVVFSELQKSLSGSGCYLIFTSASGIADDGGWEGVDVNFSSDKVNWDFIVEDSSYHYEFDFQEYEREILSLSKELSRLRTKYEVEPTEVFFPESWDEI